MGVVLDDAVDGDVMPPKAGTKAKGKAPAPVDPKKQARIDAAAAAMKARDAEAMKPRAGVQEAVDKREAARPAKEA